MATTHSLNIGANALTQIWNFLKLKGQENYQPRSKKIKSALKYYGLWKVVNQGIESFPTDLSEDPAPSNAQLLAYQVLVQT